MAFAKVQVNKGCAGGDGQSIDAFVKRLPQAITTLSGRLRNGTYTPRALRSHAIDKKDGHKRLLTIPSVSDRIVQTSVAQILTPLIDPTFSDDSFAYRPGKSVQQATSRISALYGMGYTWALEADIEKTFDTMPHAPILDRLDAILKGKSGAEQLIDLIALWLVHAQTTDGVGLAQGSPLSPLLANLLLDTLDDAFDGPNARIVRFADDFLILTRNQESALAAQSKATALLGQFGLALKSNETRVTSFDRGFQFLGKLFVRSLVMPAPDEPDAESADIMSELAESDAQDAAQDSAGHDSGGKILYVTDPDRLVAIEGRSFAVKSSLGDTLVRIAPSRVARIELSDRCDLPQDVMRHALATQTHISLINGHGEEVGAVLPPINDRASLHLAQARVCLSPDLSFDLARRIIDGRMRNQRTRLTVLNRKPQDSDVIRAIKDLGRCIRKLPHVTGDISTLRGHEGHAAAIYWPALGRLCRAHAGAFKRERPAKTPLNAAINYLTAMLARDIRAAVMTAGLHPGFGVLHSATDGHDACVWDLMEGFRARLCEGLAVTLFNRGRLKVDMFEERSAGMHIAPDGRRALIVGYEQALDRTMRSHHTGKKHALRRIMIEEARALSRHFQAPADAPFEPQTQDS